MNPYFNEKIPFMIALGLPEFAVPQLKQYIEHLTKSNEELNLISRKMTFEDLIDNHIIDCLLPLYHFPQNINTAADFGTGGGLPGIIYAICFPEIKFSLYEKSILKQEFLNSCKTFAPNIQVFSDIPQDLIKTDVVIARGFKAIDVILDMSRLYFQNNGKYFLLKARLEKINEELILTDKKFKNLKHQIIKLKSPALDVERHLVLIN